MEPTNTTDQFDQIGRTSRTLVETVYFLPLNPSSPLLNVFLIKDASDRWSLQCQKRVEKMGDARTPPIDFTFKVFQYGAVCVGQIKSVFCELCT